MHAFRRFFLTVAGGFLCVALAGCRLTDVRVTDVQTPDIRCETCAMRIYAALEALPGLDPQRIEIDLEARTVRVVYDSMRLALKNIEFAIVNAGYAANALPADPEARAALPPECREHTD